jgi:hypothetical protein
MVKSGTKDHADLKKNTHHGENSTESLRRSAATLPLNLHTALVRLSYAAASRCGREPSGTPQNMPLLLTRN